VRALPFYEHTAPLIKRRIERVDADLSEVSREMVEAAAMRHTARAEQHHLDALALHHWSFHRSRAAAHEKAHLRRSLRSARCAGCIEFFICAMTGSRIGRSQKASRDESIRSRNISVKFRKREWLRGCEQAA
jgi:hypothetical protein